jgi:phospholipid/cholesterol/gamma-HCH transport system substrate-binding protein
VSHEGYISGRVAGIRPYRDGQDIVCQVELSVQKGWKIPDDGMARAHSEGLLSDTVIEIAEGESNQFPQIGATLHGAPSRDFFSAMSEVASDSGDLSDNSICPLLAVLNQVVQQPGGEMRLRVPIMLKATDSLVSKLDQSATHLSELMNAETAQQKRCILNDADPTVSDLRSLAAGLTQLKRDSLQMMQKLDQPVTGTRPDLEQAVAAVRDILQQVYDYSGNILLNLDNSSRNLNEFSRNSRDNPAPLLGGRAPTGAGCGVTRLRHGLPGAALILRGCITHSRVPEDRFYGSEALAPSISGPPPVFPEGLDVAKVSADPLRSGLAALYRDSRKPLEVKRYHYPDSLRKSSRRWQLRLEGRLEGLRPSGQCRATKGGDRAAGNRLGEWLRIAAVDKQLPAPAGKRCRRHACNSRGHANRIGQHICVNDRRTCDNRPRAVMAPRGFRS